MNGLKEYNHDLGCLIGADVARLYEELGIYSPREEAETTIMVEDFIRNYDFLTGNVPERRSREVTMDVYTLLDYIEECRQMHDEDPHRNPADFLFRSICAEIAERAGIGDRAFWTGALKEDPGSCYYKRYHGAIGEFRR